MDPIAYRIARRFLAGELAEGVFDDTDLKELSHEDRAQWKGYGLRLIHHTYTAEEWAESAEPATRQEHAGPFKTLDEVVRHLGSLKFEAWEESWLSGKPTKGVKQVVQVDAQVTRHDGHKLSIEERNYLSSRLKLRR